MLSRRCACDITPGRTRGVKENNGRSESADKCVEYEGKVTADKNKKDLKRKGKVADIRRKARPST